MKIRSIKLFLTTIIYLSRQQKKYLIFLWIACAMFFMKTNAQDNLPRVYEIKTDTASINIPDSCWQMLGDAEGEWTINQVSQSLLSGKFHQNADIADSLLSEMRDEIDKGNLEDAKTIANDVIDNEQKILHHRKRADASVKGMLQHSRVSTGQKELTDINKLADEYLRLSYHGLRAKDKSFNVTMQTDFDATIGKINIVPQDIGRVLLNLFNNAFYAMNEKAKLSANSYKPTAIVCTKKLTAK